MICSEFLETVNIFTVKYKNCTIVINVLTIFQIADFVLPSARQHSVRSRQPQRVLWHNGEPDMQCGRLSSAEYRLVTAGRHRTWQRREAVSVHQRYHVG